MDPKKYEKIRKKLEECLSKRRVHVYGRNDPFHRPEIQCGRACIKLNDPRGCYLIENMQEVVIEVNSKITKLVIHRCNRIVVVLREPIICGLEIFRCSIANVTQRLPTFTQIDYSSYVTFCNLIKEEKPDNDNENWILLFNCYVVRYGNDYLPANMFDHGKLIHFKQAKLCCTQYLEKCLPSRERVPPNLVELTTGIRSGKNIPVVKCAIRNQE
jgi:hypothetical protein